MCPQISHRSSRSLLEVSPPMRIPSSPVQDDPSSDLFLSRPIPCFPSLPRAHSPFEVCLDPDLVRMIYYCCCCWLGHGAVPLCRHVLPHTKSQSVHRAHTHTIRERKRPVPAASPRLLPSSSPQSQHCLQDRTTSHTSGGGTALPSLPTASLPG